jgi:hypothetical protein
MFFIRIIGIKAGVFYNVKRIVIFVVLYQVAHVIEQPNFRIPNPQYFVYLLDQTVG